jgi:hypothetical protein
MAEPREAFVEPEIVKHEEKLAAVTEGIIGIGSGNVIIIPGGGGGADDTTN